MPQDALTGPGIPHQARAFNTLMHGEVSFEPIMASYLHQFSRSYALLRYQIRLAMFILVERVV